MKESSNNNPIKEVPISHPLVQKKINKTLNLSIEEGGYSSAHNSFGSTYFGPFALAMNATSSQIGILSGIENLIPAITQLFSCKLIEKKSRKKIIVSATIIQAVLWIPIILTSLLYFNNIPYTIWILIGIIGLFFIFNGIIVPAWFSLMGSIVPENERGCYFAKRSRYAQFIGVLTMFISAIFLDIAKKVGSQTGQVAAYTILGFSIIFTLAIICRLLSSYLISKQYEPKLIIKKKDHYTFTEFLKNIKHDIFGRFALFNAIFRFSVGIASPFFVVFIIKDLGYSYTWFIIIMVSQIISEIIFLKIIGKMSDHFGNIFLTKVSTIIISLTPLTFFLSYFIPTQTLTILYLIFFAQLLNGIGWAGFDLSTRNYVYDVMKKEKQGYALAYTNLLNGISFFLGAIIGSIITGYYQNITGIILIVFIISFVARMSTAVFASKILKEVRQVETFRTDYLLHQIYPLNSITNQINHLNPLNAKVIHHI